MRMFVYGTLKKGFGNHSYFLQDAEYIGEAETKPEFTMLHLGGFPGVVHVGNTVIKGEVYEVNVKQLPPIDRLEGHPRFYERQVVDTTQGSAWMYLLPEERLSQSRIIETGVWG